MEGTLVHLALWSNRSLGISLQLSPEMCLKNAIGLHKVLKPWVHRTSHSHSGPSKICVLWHLNSFEDLDVKGSCVTVLFSAWTIVTKNYRCLFGGGYAWVCLDLDAKVPLSQCIILNFLFFFFKSAFWTLSKVLSKSLSVHIHASYLWCFKNTNADGHLSWS